MGNDKGKRKGRRGLSIKGTKKGLYWMMTKGTAGSTKLSSVVPFIEKLVVPVVIPFIFIGIFVCKIYVSKIYNIIYV